MSLRDEFKAQRIASGITGILGGTLGLAGIISGNRGLAAAGAGFAGASFALNPDIPMWRRPYPYIRNWCMDFYHYRPRLSYFNSYVDRWWGHRHHHHGPHFGMLGPMRHGGPHR